MKVVIDTNCLLASIPPKGKHYWLYEAFESERFIWCVSNEILMEYEEKLIEKYSVRTADIVMSILTFAPNTTFAEPFYKWQLIESDPDDDKFFDLAFSIGVDYLVTNDTHFDIVKTKDFPTVNVLNLTEFKQILEV